MLGVVISPLPLSVDPDDFILVAEVQEGDEQGKRIYANTRWIQANSKILFSGEDHNTSLIILENELKNTDNVIHTLSHWIDQSDIVVLAMDEVVEFGSLYDLTKNKLMFEALSEEQYDDNATVAQILLLNGLDVLLAMSRRESGGN